MIRVERHALGPRCFVLGRRLHEWHAGVVLLAFALAAVAADAFLRAGALAAIGAWLVAKDYNDFFPSRRNTTAWSFGFHRRPLALRARHRAAGLPRLLAALTATVGAINVASALTPELPARAKLLAQLAPRDLVLAAHAFVLPAGVVLLVLSLYLARRRRRALWCAVGLLGAIGGLELLKGLDFEEALISWGLAGVLVRERDAFTVRHVAGTLRTSVRRALTTLTLATLVSAVGVVAGALWIRPTPTLAVVAQEIGALLTLSGGPVRFSDAFAWVPLAVGLTMGAALAIAAWELFRPLAVRHEPPSDVACRLVRQHGHDTLSAFKLRGDLSTLVARDGRAFVSYRVQSGVLMLSGDPVGPDDALPALVRELSAFAAERGLRLGAIGAGAGFAALAAEAGLRAMYLGDEAIVETAAFTLEGKPIKKVRQAVNRLVREGYTAEVRVLGDLEPGELAELEAVSDRWRDGAPERGFSMAMEGLRGPYLADSVVVVARDGERRARGYLHFVPAYGRPAMSLSTMRRDRDTPNGLTDFLVVRAIQELGETGIEELSLNFATFARWLHSPQGRIERVLASVVRKGNSYFQIESLFNFNAKFFPRWEPRYLLHDGVAALPRTALAALWIEGQVPRPQLPRWAARAMGA
jgi:lysyl-tRNA synthetase class 2